MGTRTGLYSSERFVLHSSATCSLGAVPFRFAKVAIDLAGGAGRFREIHRRAAESARALHFIPVHRGLRSDRSASFAVPVDSTRVHGIL